MDHSAQAANIAPRPYYGPSAPASPPVERVTVSACLQEALNFLSVSLDMADSVAMRIDMRPIEARIAGGGIDKAGTTPPPIAAQAMVIRTLAMQLRERLEGITLSL